MRLWRGSFMRSVSSLFKLIHFWRALGVTVIKPTYAPELNPVEYFWVWFNLDTTASNFLDNFSDLHVPTCNKHMTDHMRSLIIVTCFALANLWGCHELFPP